MSFIQTMPREGLQMWVGNPEVDELVKAFNKMRLRFLQQYGKDITEDNDVLAQFFVYVMKSGYNYGYAAKTLEDRLKDDN